MSAVRERYQGFCTAMEQAGLMAARMGDGDYQREFGQQSVAVPVQPTGSPYCRLRCQRLSGARSARRLARQWAPGARGAIVSGLDDANYADFTQPRISTIRQPARELGRTAVNIMMRLANDDPDILRKPACRLNGLTRLDQDLLSLSQNGAKAPKAFGAKTIN